MKRLVLATLCLMGAAAVPAGVSRPDYPQVTPDAIADLRDAAGARLLGARWRYRDVAVDTVNHHAPGPDRKPTGPAITTHDISPRVTDAAFDTGWTDIAPGTLEDRRSSGKLSFGWYRLGLTVPDRIGALPAEGATLVLEATVDDYAEIWVNGAQTFTFGSRGGAVAGGWNAPSRVVLTRDAHAGDTFDVAIFAANGPLGNPPGNYVWIRNATVEAYAPGRFTAGEMVPLTIDRRSPELDAVIAPGTGLEQIATGFRFTEGPVWQAETDSLLFSDPNNNAIYRWNESEGVSVWRAKSGYTGADIGDYGQPGSNGLAFDAEGRLTICEHGNRRVTRLEKNGTLTVVADRAGGKRLNSPNDLVYRRDGVLYFTDPPFGLPMFHADPRRELDSTPVVCVADGKARIVSTDLTGPNGLAFSPDEKFLYVTNWDEQGKVVMRYESLADGTLANGRVFFDMTASPGAEALDGIKVDARGNLFVSGPGGLWIISPEGAHLGTLVCPELPANMAWGDADGRTLYLTARTGLYRLRVANPSATQPAVPGTTLAQR